MVPLVESGASRVRHCFQSRRHPKTVRAMTSLSVAKLAARLRKALPALVAADEAWLSRPGRRRAIEGRSIPKPLPSRAIRCCSS